jgi:glycosyltransferase involved in cell wall biosynthesis
LKPYAGSNDRIDITVVLDSPDENWPSMDLAGEMLLEEWRSMPAQVKTRCISLPIPRMARRLLGSQKQALNADRAFVRYLAYPARALVERRPNRFFHIADHSYAQTVYVLPARRTGVYCHDLDAFRAILTPETEQPDKASAPFRALARALLWGLKSAAVVFYSTREVGRALEAHGIAPPSRLVHAPYGVAPEFDARHDPTDGTDGVLSRLRGQPFVLHVGSSATRKRLEVLFEVFARLRAQRPELHLVQQGAALTAEQQACVRRLGIEGAFVQPPKLARRTLAGLYRRAAVVLVTSDAEGFGFPVIEALACGAIVVASDIPVLREVGSDAALYAPVGDVQAWTEVAGAVLDGRTVSPTKELRTERASAFTWDRHAQTILAAYEDIAEVRRRGARAPSAVAYGNDG